MDPIRRIAMYIQHCSKLVEPASTLSKSLRRAVVAALLALVAGIAALTPVSGHADEFSPRSIRVSIAGLDPNSAEGARKIYVRLEHAAWTVCGESVSDIQVLATGGPSKCVKEALAHAVRDVRSAELARIYIKKNGSKLAREYKVTPEILTAQK
jgi:UrcA family protein